MPIPGGKRPRVFRTGHAYEDIAALLGELALKGRCLDLPAGKGVNIEGIRRAGFEPVAADLFAEKAAETGAPCVRADFNEPLPFADGAFAAVLCSEGIEHLPRQLDLLREFARVLQPGGSVLITTPNALNLRARFAWLLTGHMTFKRGVVNEVTTIRETTAGGRPYIGHAFVPSYFTLRFLLKCAGFEAIRVTTAKYSPTSLVLAPLLWLPVRFATGGLLRTLGAQGHGDVADEIRRHVLCRDLLFGKKLIVLATKPSA